MDPVLLIFIALAGFIAYRLYTVLGSRTGHEQRREAEAVKRSATPAEPRIEASSGPTPVKAAGPISPAAEPLRAADPAFDEAGFIAGAKGAYEMIVEAFAGGDLKSIRRYLGQSVYDAFKAALADRETRGLAQELKFVGIDHARILSSEAKDGELYALVEFASNQVRVTRDKDAAIIEGDPSRIDLVKDRWTFSRRLASNDPNWILVATGGAV